MFECHPNKNRFRTTSRCTTYLIHHINNGLRVTPKEAVDRVTLILTREDYFDQGGEFIQSECASDQTPADWNIGVGKAGVINTLHMIGEGGAEDVPLLDAEVVAASWESMGAESGTRSLELRAPSRGALGALRVLCISWIFSLCPSTLPLLRLIRGIFAPLLRVRSISRVTLELLGRGTNGVKANGHTFPNPRVPPSRIH